MFVDRLDGYRTNGVAIIVSDGHLFFTFLMFVSTISYAVTLF